MWGNESVLTPFETAQQTSQQFTFVRCTDEKSKTLKHGPRRPSISVNVQVRRARDLVVDNMVDRWDIETAGSDIGGEKDTLLSLFEPMRKIHQASMILRETISKLDRPIEVLQPLPLLQLRMKRPDFDIK